MQFEPLVSVLRGSLGLPSGPRRRTIPGRVPPEVGRFLRRWLDPAALRGAGGMDAVWKAWVERGLSPADGGLVIRHGREICRPRPLCGACSLRDACRYASRGPRLRELHRSELPRERLLRDGPRSLTGRELVAILLRTGSARENVLDLAGRLEQHFHGIGGLARASPEELQRFPGLGPAKAAALLAALELSRRMGPSEMIPGRGETFPDAAAVAREVAPVFRGLPQERFFALLLDNRHRLIARHEVSVGTLNSSPVHPREAFREAIRRSAAAVVFAHNHPSGDPTPSPEDIAVTERLVSVGRLVGIPLLDHLVWAESGFVSLARLGHVPRADGA